MQKTDKTTLTLLFALIFSMLLLSVEGFFAQCEAIRGDTLRLHILAASDDAADQQNKLLVRDAILAEYSDLLSGKTPAQARHFAAFLLSDIELTANRALRAAGCPDAARAEVAKTYFDSRVYQNGLTLPAGEYTALKITIGEGKGQNWWCVLYPPLCVPACMSGEARQAAQQIEALNTRPAFEAKLAVLELAQQIKAAVSAAF